VVPATVAELVAGRVDALHPAHRRCVEAAAVLGPQFDWRLLPSMVDTTAAAVYTALRAAIRAGLVQAQQGDGFKFHHALGRDAVLDALLPPERVDWARRGFAAVAAAHPELETPSASSWPSWSRARHGRRRSSTSSSRLPPTLLCASFWTRHIVGESRPVRSSPIVSSVSGLLAHGNSGI
jgi:hypothetical protein